jgi:hypothetical protein
MNNGIYNSWVAGEDADYEADTEPEAMFKAGEWILQNIAKGIK